MPRLLTEISESELLLLHNLVFFFYICAPECEKKITDMNSTFIRSENGNKFALHVRIQFFLDAGNRPIENFHAKNEQNYHCIFSAVHYLPVHLFCDISSCYSCQQHREQFAPKCMRSGRGLFIFSLAS